MHLFIKVTKKLHQPNCCEGLIDNKADAPISILNGNGKKQS